MKLLFANQKKFKIPQGFLKKWVKALSKELQRHGEEIQGKQLILAFVDSAGIKKLNKTYRGKNKPTDVLSFEPIEEKDLGELVLCPSVLRKQAKDHKLPYEMELGYMVLHGVLHLLGYEHEKSAKEAKKMFRLQEMIFEALLESQPTGTAKGYVTRNRNV